MGPGVMPGDHLELMVTLNVDKIKAGFCSFIDSRGLDLKELMERQIAHLFSKENLQRAVEEEVKHVFAREIHQIIQSAASSALYAPEVIEAIRKKVRKAVVDSVTV